MTESNEFLLRTLEENWRHARQAEDKRAAIATVNLLIASAAQGVIAFTGWNQRLLPLTLWLIVIGLYGIVTSLKLYERSQYHILRAREIRADLDTQGKVEQRYRQAEEQHQKHYAFMMHVRLNTLWMGLHSLIIIMGIVYTLLLV